MTIFQKDTQLNSIISRTLKNNKQNYLGYNYQKLIIEEIDQIFDNISVMLSHVLLTSKWDAECLVRLNEVKYKQMTHISRNDYFDKVYGVVYRKNIDQYLADSFNLMYV